MTRCLYCGGWQATFPDHGKCPNCGAPLQWSERPSLAMPYWTVNTASLPPQPTAFVDEIGRVVHGYMVGDRRRIIR